MGMGKRICHWREVGGELLLISQFTLYANCRKGNRPSFIEAGAPQIAEPLYEYMIRKAKGKRICCRERKLRCGYEGFPCQ